MIVPHECDGCACRALGTGSRSIRISTASTFVQEQLPFGFADTDMSFLGLGGSQVVHIVLFKFQADAESHLIAKTCSDFTALATHCLNKKGSKYISSIKSGKDMSIEGKSKGLESCTFEHSA